MMQVVLYGVHVKREGARCEGCGQRSGGGEGYVRQRIAWETPREMLMKLRVKIPEGVTTALMLSGWVEL